MLFKAGAVSLILLLASRVLGLARESAQAAAFGATGLADVAVLMLTLPDWIAGMLASGALAYVLLPAWAAQPAGAIHAGQRRVAHRLLAIGTGLMLAAAASGQYLVRWLAPGLPAELHAAALHGLAWSAAAIPAALLAALWVTRLQHEQDVVGMYAANLVVNLALVLGIGLWAARGRPGDAVPWLGLALGAAMLLRLAWLAWRQRLASRAPAVDPGVPHALPAARLWLWAGLAAALPLALPFVARSMASSGGAGNLALFNYAWKLVELPLALAIQLVAALAFPGIARALAGEPGACAHAVAPVRSAFAWAWTLACAAAAGLQVGAGALADLLFGWGRMDAAALAQVAQWGRAASWSLLPQALAAVALTVLATQRRLHVAALAYAVAVAGLLVAGAAGVQEGRALMVLLDALFALAALLALAALGGGVRWLPWRTLAVSTAALALVASVAAVVRGMLEGAGTLAGLATAGAAAAAVVVPAWLGSAGLRQALRR